MLQLRQYARYASFFIKYNPVLAACLLIDEMKGEAKYDLHTTGFNKVERSKLKGPAALDAHPYMPSNYVLLERLYKKINRFGHNRTFLDIGCGKGRAMLVAAHFGFKEIYGIEVVESYCSHLQQHINKVALNYPDASFKVICSDAAYYEIPDHMQTIFFYNPFKEVVMSMVLKNIMNSLNRHPRNLFIIYLNPSHIKLFYNAGFTEIFRTTRFSHLKASILIHRHSESSV